MPEITQEDLDKFKAAQTQLDALKKENDDLKKAKPDPKPKDDQGDEGDEGDDDEGDLRKKAAKNRQKNDDSDNETKKIESALTFTMGIPKFLTENKDFLPSEIEGIVKQAESERYDSKMEKAGALKGAFIQSFFSIQDNLDLLTPTHKSQVQDYLKLTVKGRAERAATVYENVFEPALEMVRRVKKAEELGRANSNFASGDKVQDDYKKRLIDGAKKTHLKEKGDK